jgi:hypothetical protein
MIIELRLIAFCRHLLAKQAAKIGFLTRVAKRWLWPGKDILLDLRTF